MNIDELNEQGRKVFLDERERANVYVDRKRSWTNRFECVQIYHPRKAKQTPLFFHKERRDEGLRINESSRLRKHGFLRWWPCAILSDRCISVPCRESNLFNQNVLRISVEHLRWTMFKLTDNLFYTCATFDRVKQVHSVHKQCLSLSIAWTVRTKEINACGLFYEWI